MIGSMMAWKSTEKSVTVAAIVKIINSQLDEPLTYNSYRYFIRNDEELSALLDR